MQKNISNSQIDDEQEQVHLPRQETSPMSPDSSHWNIHNDNDKTEKEEPSGIFSLTSKNFKSNVLKRLGSGGPSFSSYSSAARLSTFKHGKN